MKRKWDIRRIHLWFGITIGAAFTVWVISGLLMLIGPPTPSGEQRGPSGKSHHGP